MIQASGDTDLLRGSRLQPDHVIVVIMEIPVTEKICLRRDLHK